MQNNNISLDVLVRALQKAGGQSVGLGYGQPGNHNMKHAQKQVLTAVDETLYGCCGLFSVCGPDAILSRVIQDTKFSTWLGWQQNNDCYQFVKTITWIGQEGTAAHDVESSAGAPCDEPPTVEWGACEYLLEKGLLRQCGQAIYITVVGERYCDKQPLYTWEGQRINNDLDWQAIMAGMVLQNEVDRLAVVGNRAVAGEFDGLENLVNTGYVDVHTAQPCTPIDSLVVDWGSAAMSAALITQVIALVRRIRQRAARNGGIRSEDMVISMPAFLRDCFMDQWVCFGFCDETGDSTSRWETRDREEKYRGGGLYGDGYITVDGVDVSLLVNDWIPWTSVAPTLCSDIYILTRRIGNLPIMYLQWQNMNEGAAALTKQAGYSHYTTSDGGRFMHWIRSDELCVQVCLALKPSLFLSAPWAQARVDNVCCETVGDLDPELPQSCNYYAGGFPPIEVSCPSSYYIT